MTIDQIEEIIRREHGGAWYYLFHEAEGAFRFLPSRHVLTPRAYDEIRRRFGAGDTEETAVPDAAERRKNDLRARADGGRRV